MRWKRLHSDNNSLYSFRTGCLIRSRYNYRTIIDNPYDNDNENADKKKNHSNGHDYLNNYYYNCPYRRYQYIVFIIVFWHGTVCSVWNLASKSISAGFFNVNLLLKYYIYC